MLELQNLLLVPVTARMVSHAVPLVPQLHPAGIGLGVDLDARCQGHRIEVGPYLGTAQTIDRGKARKRQVHALAGQRQQMGAFDQLRRPDRLAPTADGALLILPTRHGQLPV